MTRGGTCRSRFGRVLLLALLFALLGLAGCDRIFDKGSKDDLAEGDKKSATGDFKGAIAEYEAAFDGTEKTAEAHYRIAVIYDDKLKRPRDAIHHFDRYLELAPTGPHARDAQAIRQQAELKLSRSQGTGSGIVTQEEATRLKNNNLQLQKMLAELRAQKALPAPAANPAKGGEQAQKPVPAGARTHTVAAGETLASIAAKYYKNKGKWKDIQEANFYSTEGTPKIKAGQVLIIP